MGIVKFSKVEKWIIPGGCGTIPGTMGREFMLPPIAKHPGYPSLVLEYNKILKEAGKVNNQKFYLDFVATLGISQTAWYRFVKNYVTEAGLVVSNVPTSPGILTTPPGIPGEISVVDPKEIVSSPIAIQRGIAAALNIGLTALNDILSGRALLTPEKKAELLFKAMKAQDSRIGAIARIKKDHREEVEFEKAFGEAAYTED